MRAAKVQASLRIRAVSPEPSLLAYTSSESRGTFRQKARSQAPLNGWACAVKICHDGMLEDTNSLDGAHMVLHLFVNYAHIDLCHFFSSSWCRGWAAASACGSSDFSIYLFVISQVKFDKPDFTKLFVSSNSSCKPNAHWFCDCNTWFCYLKVF